MSLARSGLNRPLLRAAERVAGEREGRRVEDQRAEYLRNPPKTALASQCRIAAAASRPTPHANTHLCSLLKTFRPPPQRHTTGNWLQMHHANAKAGLARRPTPLGDGAHERLPHHHHRPLDPPLPLHELPDVPPAVRRPVSLRASLMLTSGPKLA
eukprot:156095-Rhodomonas_salina.2